MWRSNAIECGRDAEAKASTSKACRTPANDGGGVFDGPWLHHEGQGLGRNGGQALLLCVISGSAGEPVRPFGTRAVMEHPSVGGRPAIAQFGPTAATAQPPPGGRGERGDRPCRPKRTGAGFVEAPGDRTADAIAACATAIKPSPRILRDRVPAAQRAPATSASGPARTKFRLFRDAGTSPAGKPSLRFSETGASSWPGGRSEPGFRAVPPKTGPKLLPWP